MMGHQRRHGQQLRKASTIRADAASSSAPCRGSACGRARRTGRRRAPPARASPRRRRAPARAGPEREAELQEPERRPDQLDVAGRVAGLAVHLVPIRMPSRSTAWIRTPARRSRRRTRRARAARPPRPRRARPPPPRARVGEAELAVEDPTDRGEPLALERRIRRIRSACSSRYQATRPSLSGCGRRPRGLVVARVHGDVAGARELLDAVPHDRELYECSLTRSSREGMPARKGPSVRCRPWTPAAAADHAGRRGARGSHGHPRPRAGMPGGHADAGRDPQGPVRRRRLGGRTPVPAPLLHGHRAAVRHGAAGRGRLPTSTTAPRRTTTATSTPC